MEYVYVTKDNLEEEHICCAISNNKDIQVSSVPLSIEADPYILSQYLVHAVRLLSVFSVHGCCIAPFC